MKKLIATLMLAIPLSAMAFPIYTGVGANGKDRWSDSHVLVDQAGNPWNNAPTYSYQLAAYVPAATATDVACLVGSASAVLRLNRIQVTADATGSSVLDVYVIKRSTANTGGTATQPAFLSLDSTNAVAKGVVNLYSANPSALGTGITIAGDHYEIPSSTGPGYSASAWVEDFGTRNNQPIVIRGANESVCFNLNGATLPAGLNVFMRIEWVEEAQ